VGGAFLGLMDGAPRFVLGIEPPAIEALKSHADFEITDLRTIAVRGLVAEEHLPPLAEGKSLLIWHGRRKFCSNCGAQTRVVEAGWRRDCPNCKMQHFPRTDPVVIMLAIDGQGAGERCLLGRSGRFATNSWSCLAGFVEPGETIEDAVRREVHEEAGVVCGKVNYFLSQPWPFPSSLMIGCHAQALTQELIVDHNELEGARWFDREEIALMLARQHPEGLITPVPVAIAYHIIRHWVENGVAFD
jgi:NAD+ diphosphatase